MNWQNFQTFNHHTYGFGFKTVVRVMVMIINDSGTFGSLYHSADY